MIDGRDKDSLEEAFSRYSGKHHVQQVSIDMSPLYRNAIKRNFPKASIVVDRFHVHRLFTRLVNKFRKKITGDNRKNPIRKLVLRNHDKLLREERYALNIFLNHPSHRDLKEVYEYKEAMNRFYRIKGYARAREALIRIVDRMGRSSILKVKKIRLVLLEWGREILNYFKGGLSNGRVEGFNRKAKLVQRKAYGYSSFKNYRLRLLGDYKAKGVDRKPTIK